MSDYQSGYLRRTFCREETGRLIGRLHLLCYFHQGQVYIPTITKKIAKLRSIIDRRGMDHVELEVDGGLHVGNAAEVVNAGVSIIVAGSAIFKQHASIRENYLALRQLVQAQD